MTPRFFRSAADFHRWLAKNHATADELLVGFYNQRSGKKGITYKEAVDEALCFGWIDGVRKSVDDGRYTVRFTPRRARSIWSLVNAKRVGELEALGRMAAPGREAFARRDEKRTGIYSFERERAQLRPRPGAALPRQRTRLGLLPVPARPGTSARASGMS